MDSESKDITGSGVNASFCESNSSNGCASLKSKSAASVLSAIRNRKHGSVEGVDSLNLLKDNVQYFFNEKVQALMTEFVQTFFHPAIKNIENNTNETITGDQLNRVCRDLFESCAKTKFPPSNESLSSPTCSSISSIVEMSVSDSDEGQQEPDVSSLSLLHQALKRKRTDSETEQLFKRQFFLATAPQNKYFNSANQEPEKICFQPANSSPKFISKPANNQSTTRPMFHIIQSPNQIKKLSATHVELCHLLNQNKSNTATVITKDEDNDKT